MKPFDPRLLRLAPSARPGIVGLGVLGAVSGIAAIAQAFAVAHLVLAVVRGESFAQPALWVLLAFALRGLAHAATEVVAARAGAVVSADLRRALAARVMAGGIRGKSATAGASDDGAASLTLLTHGVTSIEPYVARYLPSLVAAAVIPVAAVLAMASLDLVTALIPVLTLPLLPLFAALIGMATRDATERRWRSLAHLSGHFLDVMKGLPTLVGYSRAHRQSRTIAAVSEDHRRATVGTLRIAFLSSAALEFLATISVAIVAVWTGIALAEGRMELHIALPLILLAPEAYWPIRRVGAEFHNAADGATALEEIATVLDEPSSHGPEASDTVEVRGLEFAYADDVPPVLVDVDATWGRGLTVLVGPSGAGKTTLLELLAGLREPTRGSVRAPRAHLVTQRPFLAAASMRDNLLLGAAGTPDDATLRDTLERVGLADLLASLPDGLDTPLGDDGFGLSAGQRARFALARALLSDAPLVLLDEPTAHLDPDTEHLVGQVVRNLADERIVIAVSHRPHLVDLADARFDVAASSRETR
ncbi:MAG: thiol reductant ABC exporter subunit CydD [Mobilicoccus sp.]|nr:thiol reductant ABC exporter subunit CydD [Mobilicoccus sp.]